jgi:hypothetical protein
VALAESLAAMSRPRSPVDDDDACRAIAGRIQRQHPDWLVLWGCFSKRYVAFPLFPVRRRAIVTAYYSRALISRMSEVEHVLGIRSEEGEGNRE